jgi:hypothetical protein
MASRVSMNRRRFLKRTAALAGAAAASQVFGLPHVLAADSPNTRLGIAVIGCGGQDVRQPRTRRLRAPRRPVRRG